MRWSRDSLHCSQSGPLIQQLLDVGAIRALGLSNGAAFLQWPGGIGELFPQRFQVGVTLVAVGVGQERQQLGGAQGTGYPLCLVVLMGRGCCFHLGLWTAWLALEVGVDVLCLWQLILYPSSCHHRLAIHCGAVQRGEEKHV